MECFRVEIENFYVLEVVENPDSGTVSSLRGFLILFHSGMTIKNHKIKIILLFKASKPRLEPYYARKTYYAVWPHFLRK